MKHAKCCHFHPVTRPLFCLGLILLAACGPSKDEVIQQKITALVSDYSRKYSIERRSKLLEEASRVADSLLLAEAQAQLRDSLNRARPNKPVEPPVVPPIDSLAIKPIF
jgi:hypothetical protein